MGTKIDKLREIAQPRSEEAKNRAKWRRENREWLRMSQSIALLVLDHLHTTGTTQKELAERMGVSPAYIAKVLKGGENLSLETICKLQESTGVELVSVPRPYTSEMIVVLPPSPAESSVTLQWKEVA